MTKISKKKSINIKTVIFIGAFCASIAYFCMVFFLQKNINALREIPEPLINITSLPTNVKMETLFRSKAGEHPLELERSKIEVPDDLRQNFSLPYEINATFDKGKGKPGEVSWSIDGQGKYYSISISNFTSDDIVNLFLNDIHVVKSTPLDWSGRMSLRYVLLMTEDTNACLSIGQKNKEQPIILCHLLTGKTG